jgi:hypothetical protein
MKKALFVCLLIGAASVAAADVAQLNFVKQVYREVRARGSEEAVLMRHADSGLKAALRHADQVAKGGDICLDSQYLYPGQDPDFRTTPRFSMAGNHVKVVVTQYGSRSTVYVDAKCNGGSCQISDVVAGGSSLKAAARSCR